MTSNPEIESQLQALAELCCRALSGHEAGTQERVEPLLKALLMSGYARSAQTTLQADLEARVKKLCPQAGGHRGEELLGLTRQFQDKFNNLALWESKQPEGYPPARPANISSATDS